MAQVRVIDVSEWQGYQLPGSPHIDWAAVKASGSVAGAIIRVGYGTAYVDHDAVYNITQARRVGLPMGTYLYAVPGGDPIAAGNAHAAAYTNVVNQAGGIHGNDLLCALDVESTGGWTPAQLLQFISQWQAAMQVAVPAPRPALAVYSYAAFFRAYLQDLGNGLGRWVADYGEVPPPGPWIGWQYTDQAQVAGVPTPCDASYFDPAAIGLVPADPCPQLTQLQQEVDRLQAKIAAALRDLS